MSKTKGHVVINVEECKGCGICIETCPADVLYQSDDLNSHGYHPAAYKGEGCRGCGFCYYSCPEPGAITVFKDWEEITETGYCPHCEEEHKIFKRDENEDYYYCTKCLNKIEKENTPA
jgi:NAD-dependent dihydropyrimidine dehydrogenase PreA subunit